MLSRAPIFDQEWWYEAATAGKWQQVDYSIGQNIQSKLIFSTHRRRGITTIGMPRLARVMQPVIDLGFISRKDTLADTIKVLSGLLKALPRFDRFSYTLPPESRLDLAYSLAGYSVTANYTFRSDPSGSHDPWKAMDQKVRYNIKTGSKRMAVETHGDILRYVGMSRRFIKNRAFSNLIDYDAICRIWEACRHREQASILTCVDGSGQDIASAILIWDDVHLYYWLNCRDPESNDYAANSVLIWNAIEVARKAGLIFDMDGYANPTAGIFLSKFGLLPQRRFDISMTNSSARLRTAFSSHLVEMVGPKLRLNLLAFKNRINPV